GHRIDEEEFWSRHSFELFETAEAALGGWERVYNELRFSKIEGSFGVTQQREPPRASRRASSRLTPSISPMSPGPSALLPPAARAGPLRGAGRCGTPCSHRTSKVMRPAETLKVEIARSATLYPLTRSRNSLQPFIFVAIVNAP